MDKCGLSENNHKKFSMEYVVNTMHANNLLDRSIMYFDGLEYLFSYLIY